MTRNCRHAVWGALCLRMNDEVATLSLSLQLTETKRKWDVFAEASREQPDLVVCGRLPGLRGLGIIKKKTPPCQYGAGSYEPGEAPLFGKNGRKSAGAGPFTTGSRLLSTLGASQGSENAQRSDCG